MSRHTRTTATAILLTLACTVLTAAPARASQPVLQLGTTHAAVLTMERWLTELGYVTGAVDSYYGTGTLSAVKAFQRDHGLPQTGVVASLTWAALNHDIKAVRALPNLPPLSLSVQGQSSRAVRPPVIMHVVRPGDTLERVAGLFRVTPESIVMVNSLALGQEPVPGQVIAVPTYRGSTPPAWMIASSTGSIKPFHVVGYYVDDSLGYASLARNIDTLDAVATFQYSVDRHGSVRGPAMLRARELASGYRKPVLALIHNIVGGKFNRAEVHYLLTSAAARARAVNNLFNLVDEGGFTGINIDFEDVMARDRPFYTRFLAELAAKLRPHGYLVTVSIPAKTHDNPAAGWSGAFDYRAVGAVADQVMLMAYDGHYSRGPAGPVASFPWVQRVIEYAVSVIPRHKVYLGVAVYGYDWPVGVNSARALSGNRAYTIAAERGAAIQWHAQDRVPFFYYRDGSANRVVYFENGESLGHKLDLVKEYRLGGIAMWRLGLDEPGVWTAIADKRRP